VSGGKLETAPERLGAAVTGFEVVVAGFEVVYAQALQSPTSKAAIAPISHTALMIAFMTVPPNRVINYL
jgi:hypothetical protein